MGWVSGDLFELLFGGFFVLDFDFSLFLYNHFLVEFHLVVLGSESDIE